MASSKTVMTGYPVTDFWDENEATTCSFSFSDSNDPNFESDVIAYIKNRMGQVSGAGTVHANRATVSTTNV